MLNIHFEVELWITFYARNRQHMSFKLKINVTDQLLEDFYVGMDLLGHYRKVYETNETLMLQEHNIPRTITVSPANGLFPIPIHSMNGLCEGQITISQMSVILKPNSMHTVRVDTQFPQPYQLKDLKLIFNNIYDSLQLIQATCRKDTPEGVLEITISNEGSFPIYLEPGDSIGKLVPRGRKELQQLAYETRADMPQASAAEISLLERKLSEDEFLTNEEIRDELDSYVNTGKCSMSASYAIDNSPKLQIFEMRDETVHSPEELINAIKVEHLPPEHQKLVLDMFRRNINVLAVSEFDVVHTDLIEAAIVLKPDIKICNSKYIPIPSHIRPGAIKLMKQFLDNGILEYTDEPSPFTSNVLFIPKKNPLECRGILDSRILNYHTVRMSVTMTSHSEILSLLEGKRMADSCRCGKCILCNRNREKIQGAHILLRPQGQETAILLPSAGLGQQFSVSSNPAVESIVWHP